MAYTQFTYVAAGRIVKPIITYSECVFCSLICPARNAHAPSYVVSSLACPSLPYFSTVSHKRHDIREKATQRKMCILIFSTAFVSNISHSKKNSARYYHICIQVWGTQWRSWLRHCATSQKVAGSTPDGVTGFFHWHNPSCRTMALGLTQTLTEMSTSNISWGVKGAGAWGWQPYHLHVPNVLKSGSLNLLEPSGPVQACNGITLPFFYRSPCKVSVILVTWIFWTEFPKKNSNTKFHENPSGDSRVFPCRRTDMTKLTITWIKTPTRCTLF